MLTEEEARKKWCPHVRHANGSGGTGVNRVNWDRSYNYANCIASACMAWRAEMRTVMSQYQPPSEWCEEPTGRGCCGLVPHP